MREQEDRREGERPLVHGAFGSVPASNQPRGNGERVTRSAKEIAGG